MMNRKAATIAMGLAIIAVIFGGWRFLHLRSPEYSVGQMRSALADGNRLRFERYVDVPALADQAIEAVLGRALMETVESSSSGFAMLGASLGAGIIRQMQPAISSRLRTAVLTSVENGHLDSLFTDSAPVGDGDRNINLAMIGRATAADRVTFEGMTDIGREGDLAAFGFKIRSEPLDTTLVLRMRLQRVDNRWRVVAFDNLEQYLEQVSTLQVRKLAEMNGRATEQLDKMVEFGALKLSRSGRGLTAQYDVSMEVTNLGPDTIAEIHVLLDGGTSDDDQVTAIMGRRLYNTSDVPPGETRDVEWTVYKVLQEDWYTDLQIWPVSGFEPRILRIIQTRDGDESTTQTFQTWQRYVDDRWPQ